MPCLEAFFQDSGAEFSQMVLRDKERVKAHAITLAPKYVSTQKRGSVLINDLKSIVSESNYTGNVYMASPSLIAFENY